MRSIAHSFYTSKAWETIREDYLKSVNHYCERCKAKGIYEPAKIVHHKIYLSEENFRNPEIALNFDNLEALCARCHNLEHDTGFKKGATRKRRYKISEGGDLIY